MFLNVLKIVTILCLLTDACKSADCYWTASSHELALLAVLYTRQQTFLRMFFDGCCFQKLGNQIKLGNLKKLAVKIE